MGLFDTLPDVELLDKYWPRLQNWLAYRERSEKELQEYLQYRLKLTGDDQQKMSDYVLQSDLVNNHRFAESRVAWRLRSGKGPYATAQELRQLGIGRDLIAEILARYSEEDWLAAIQSRAESKLEQLHFRHGADTQRIKQGLLRYIQGRGYHAALALRIYERLESNSDDQV